MHGYDIPSMGNPILTFVGTSGTQAVGEAFSIHMWGIHPGWIPPGIRVWCSIQFHKSTVIPQEKLHRVAVGENGLPERFGGGSIPGDFIDAWGAGFRAFRAARTHLEVALKFTRIGEFRGHRERGYIANCHVFQLDISLVHLP